MYISSIQIENYKSFAKSETIPLSSGFNVVIGTNNAGKTAFIQALSLAFETKPHNRLLSGVSSVQLVFDFTVSEFKELMSIYFFGGKSIGTFYVPIQSHDSEGNYASRFQQLFTSTPHRNTYLKILCEYSSTQFTVVELVGFSKLSRNYAIQPVIQLEINETSNIKFEGGSTNINSENLFPILFANIFKDRIYSFDAERMRVSSSPTGDSEILNKDASNLAEVLNKLQGNAKRFENFNNLVTRIFPQIAWISILPYQGHMYQIYVWDEVAYSEGNKDWAVPLSDSGTGIGQVLAILYIVITSRTAKTIIIDEPQSFLHPGAVRALFEILGSTEFRKHQYIVSTHSPQVIAACDPQNIIQIRKVEAESYVETFDKSDRLKLSEFLVEVGAKLSDVFGADDILWVEGPTEEICFQLILSKLSKKPLLGMAIIGVKNTGDFALNYKYVDKIIAMHRKLSETHNLLPQALGFLFDAEILNERDIEDYKKKGVTIIPRRMYENYLIHPKAIADILSDINGSRVNYSEIEVWLQSNWWNEEFFKPAPIPTDRSIEKWHEKVHGAKVLEAIFLKFSLGKDVYKKLRHGPQLTKWILEHNPENFDEIKTCIEQVITVGKQKLHQT